MSSNIFDLKKIEEQLPQTNVTFNPEGLDNDDLNDIIFDGEYDLLTRMKAIETLYSKDKAFVVETVNRLVGFYNLNPVELLKEYFISLIEKSVLPLELKNEFAKSLYEEDKLVGCTNMYHILNEISPPDKELPVPIQVENFRCLFQEDYILKKQKQLTLDKISTLFNKIILTNKNIENEYRYKILLSIQRDKDREYNIKYLHQGYLAFVRHVESYTKYRILASQYILQGEFPMETKMEVESICISFATDALLDYNLRADASDLLVRMAVTPDGKNVGKDMITMLGRDIKSVLPSMYNNKQNVHIEEIDKSVRDIILYFAGMESKLVNNELLTIELIQQEIESLIKKENLLKIKLVDASLTSEEQKIEDTDDWKKLDIDEQHYRRLLRKIQSSLLKN